MLEFFLLLILITAVLFPLMLGFVICRSVTRKCNPADRLCGWLTYGYAVLGFYVWGPTVIGYGGSAALDWAAVIMLAGLGFGALTGFALGRMLSILVTSDESDEVQDDDVD